MHLLWVFPTFSMGGAQRRCLSLIKEWPVEWQHTIIALDGVYHALPRHHAPNIRVHAVSLQKSGGILWRNVRACVHTLRYLRPDALMTSNFGSIDWHVASRWHKIPHVHTEDGFSGGETPTTQHPRRIWARRVLCRGRNKQYVVPSPLLQEIAIKQWWFAKKRVHCIANGIDVQAFAVPQRRYDTIHPVRVLAVGALRVEKRFDRLLRIVAAQPNEHIALTIVGEGEQRALLHNLAQELGVTVHFTGMQHDVLPYLQQADIFALTSDTEQLPIAVIEACAAGLPILSTAVGDVHTAMCAQNAALLPPAHDEHALAALLTRLLDNASLRAELGRANQMHVQQFDIAEMARQYKMWLS